MLGMMYLGQTPSLLLWLEAAQQEQQQQRQRQWCTIFFVGCHVFWHLASGEFPWCFSAQNIRIYPYLLIVACTTPQSFQVPTYRFHPVYIWGSCMRWRACITGLHWGKKIQIGHLTSGLEVFNCPLLIAPSKQTSGSCWYSLIISALTCRHKF